MGPPRPSNGGSLTRSTFNFEGAARLFQHLAEHHAARGDKEGEAAAYHQLGRIAQERHDYDQAEQWYCKSLAISEKHGIEAFAAMTYGQLGIVAAEREQFEQAGQWLIKSIRTSLRCRDKHIAARTAQNFAIHCHRAPPAEAATLRTMWEQAELGPLPELPADEDEAAALSPPAKAGSLTQLWRWITGRSR